MIKRSIKSLSIYLKTSPMAIVQALQALIELKQYQRVIEIEQNLPQNLTQDHFIRTQRIRLYSMSFQ